ncbi:MAG: hypothetical protein Q4B09_08765 [Lachnospiraceae bacterium]|nr:hypothetical protein [Lachnospiraceae bacterium]
MRCLEEDTYAEFQYDQTAAQDQHIIERVMNLAQNTPDARTQKHVRIKNGEEDSVTSGRGERS